MDNGNRTASPQSRAGHSATSRYQPEIDGLRAIAVLAVVLFHLEYKWIPGGFVGVDVFFVISGFLITRLILKEVRAGDFRFGRFYLRRLRRLGPALIVTLLATWAVAVFYLTPDHYQRFSGALISSVFSVSNLFFWAESGYFDATAELKPLLHTWSLSVEEQFYLVWPALIVLLAGRGRWLLPLMISLLSLASLYAALVFTRYEPSASFFLMPFRVYEFGLGAGLAMLPGLVRLNAVREVLVLLGVMMIAYSALVFDKFTPFPDIYALLPCMGAALLIAGGSARYMGLLLRNPVSVWIGRISYSLYLVHWPIVVLYKHITFEDVVVGKTRIALLVLTLLAAVALYYGVEKRFRLAPEARSSDVWILQYRFLIIPLLLSLGSAHAYLNDGWPGRFDAAVVNAIGNIEEKQQLRRVYIDSGEALSNLPFDEAAQKRVLVMGDSHATDMFNALYLNVEGDPRLSVRRLEIDDVCLYLFIDADRQNHDHLSAAEVDRCGKQFDAVQQSELLASVDHVVLSTRWERSSLPNLEAFTDFLRRRSKQEPATHIVLMGRTAEFRNVPSLVIKNGLTDDLQQQLAAARSSELDELNAELQQQSLALGLDYVDKLPYLCSTDSSRCDAVDDQGKVLYTDYGHWTMEGAALFGQRMLRDSDTARLLTGLSDPGIPYAVSN
ncbi:acyltransferase family protein [Granulosicoccus sp. 3-233]|uniref:acyltransferase family protein n=1 Tax=Granulosicoccus sp. 3-233 TaxID=3417969 RepID=UPI003D339D7A